MKKIVLTLIVLLFATPAWAAVNITAAQVPDSNEVIISWETVDEPNLVRAFGLNIQLDSDANILEVTGISPNYKIYPGTIQIDAQGEVTYEGTMAAEYADLPSDTLLGVGNSGVTLEAATLYAPVGPGSANAPPTSGELCSIIVSADCNLCITANVSRAGATGVVMEDPDQAVTVNYPAECLWVDVPDEPPPCYTGPESIEWASVGSPDCWCASNNPRQCYGDSIGDAQGRYNYWVGTNDLAVFVAAWNKPFADIEGEVEPISGTPLICADADHLPEGRYSYRVSANDLGIFVANWNQANAPEADCP